MFVLLNVIKPQGLEPFQFPTKFGSPSKWWDSTIVYLDATRELLLTIESGPFARVIEDVREARREAEASRSGTEVKGTRTTDARAKRWQPAGPGIDPSPGGFDVPSSVPWLGGSGSVINSTPGAARRGR
jgi:hypothetical protein